MPTLFITKKNARRLGMQSHVVGDPTITHASTGES
jgi:hypothetical protein